MKTLCWVALLLASSSVMVGDGVVAAPDAAAPSRTFSWGNYRVDVDLRPQVLRITIPDNSLGPSVDRMRIYPSPIATGQTEFVSAALLAEKAKQFDDGLLAAVELAAEQALGNLPGKAALLRTVCAALPDSEGTREAREVLFAASQLGGLAVTPPPSLIAGLASRLAEFERADYASKPVGFYTWSPELRAIFRQDRMLQSALRDARSAPALARVLRGDTTMAAYHAMLELAERLTNPLAWGDLRAILDGGAVRETVSFFPPSATHEGLLVERLFGGLPPPANFDLADEIVTRVRDGRLSLALRGESGWYDRQVWSLEPLLNPERTAEAAKLRTGDDYRALLVDLFKGLLALTRETQVKQVDVSVLLGIHALTGEPPIFVQPELTVEPLATHYLRRAQAYTYVRQVLEQAFGEAALAHMRRMTAAGPTETPLVDELERMRSLFVGAHVLACRQLGMPPDASARAKAFADVERFEVWRKALSSDPDVSGDTRMMVPVFFDQPRGRTKVWVMLGWAFRSMKVQFDTPPAFTVRKAAGGRVIRSHPPVRFVPTRVTSAFPVMAEVYVSRVLDRDEFRRLCDVYRTRDLILGALQ
jgi:hypothetical protein